MDMQRNRKPFECRICNNFKAISLRPLLNHYRCVHANEPSFSVRCNVDDCPATFKLYNSFYRHIVRKHSQVYNSIGINVSAIDDESEETRNSEDEDESIDTVNTVDDNNDEVDYDDTDPIIEDDDTDSDVSDNDNVIANPTAENNSEVLMQRSAAMFLLKTKERNKLSQVTMNTIMDNVACLIAQQNEILKEEIGRKLNLGNADSQTLSNVFEESSNVFNGISTEALLKTFVKSNLSYVAPERIELGTVLSRKRKNNKNLIGQVEESFMYIPLLKSLEQILGNAKIASILLREPYMTNSDYYYDLFDGSVYQNDPYFSEHPNAIVLIIDHDEIETCNPLGSSATKHKMDMYYYIIANIPPQYRSRRCAVELLAIAKASHVKKYGVEKILSPAIDDLITLYNGHEISVNGKKVTIYGKVLIGVGDTLGQHMWGGFKEGVGTSFQKCRQCLCTPEILQEVFQLDAITQRTCDSYDEQCKEIENADLEQLKNELKIVYGINRRSPLCRLPTFDITKQLPQDLMHIAFEGVVQYELRLVLKHLIDERLTNINLINGAILSHCYGYTELASKPPPIRETVFTGDENYKLKLEASEARLFLRLFPFLIGPLVDMKSDVFVFILELINIIQALSSPVISKATVERLKHQIATHYTNFKRLFPNKNLLPKHHYLLHLPNTIKEFGPPVRYSCYSFESAHKYFKSLAKSQNFKNLAYSLAKRHQYLQTCIFGDNAEDGSSHPLFQREKECGVVKALDNENMDNVRLEFDKVSLLPGLEFKQVHKVSWIIRLGTKYTSGAIIAIDADQETNLPIFGEILNIFIAYGHEYFEVTSYNTLNFYYPFQAYKVEKSQNKTICPYGSFLDYNVFHLKKDIKGDCFIVPKYSLVDLIDAHIEGSNPLIND